MSENNQEYSELWTNIGESNQKITRTPQPVEEDPLQKEFKQMVKEEQNPELKEILKAFGPSVEKPKAKPPVFEIKKNNAVDRFVDRLIEKIRKPLGIESRDVK